jgi:hypothetical protein
MFVGGGIGNIGLEYDRIAGLIGAGVLGCATLLFITVNVWSRPRLLTARAFLRDHTSDSMEQ